MSKTSSTSAHHVENKEMTTREKVASIYIADGCAKGECTYAVGNVSYQLPICQQCCEKRWASYGKEFVEALERVAWTPDWVARIAPCAFVDPETEKEKGAHPRPARK